MFLIFVWLYINLLHYICYWEYNLDVQYNVQLNVFIFFICWVINAQFNLHSVLTCLYFMTFILKCTDVEDVLLCSYICYCQYALSIILEAYVFPFIFYYKVNLAILLLYCLMMNDLASVSVTVSPFLLVPKGGGGGGGCAWIEKRNNSLKFVIVFLLDVWQCVLQ